MMQINSKFVYFGKYPQSICLDNEKKQRNNNSKRNKVFCGRN